jgi:hypothetical protein
VQTLDATGITGMVANCSIPVHGQWDSHRQGLDGD